ncbi:sulfurtransferase complex subunit TusC [Buchnera aphidicola (Stegophylla sp.)]|uniref:Sulfurtransferase complex subunit TusC n=1 Tax=Buchnera aphidicola (Stegophylla sp.) TaxID=2315800 RepID=A0A4D6YBR7_9GAMM|nr:sulfurtransferase complex subunit TusC [Buchnera aphidicola (Stegophylla sp.)]
MNNIAVVFSHSPYGNSLGREGLDFVLSASCFTENISIFFIGDGIFQIFKNQDAQIILLKNHTFSFNILSLCGIKYFYICYNSLIQRGFKKNIDFILKVNILSSVEIRKKIDDFDCILNF